MKSVASDAPPPSLPVAGAQEGAMLAWMQEVAPYGILTTDTELNVRTWNRWLAGHSGLAPEAAIGRPLLELFPEIPSRRMDEYFRRALCGESSVLSSVLHKHLLPLPSTSREYPLPRMLQTARIAPLMHEGRVVGTIATVEDVTQREHHARALRRQQEHDRLQSLALGHLLEAEEPLQAAADLFPQIAGPLKLEVYLNYLLVPGSRELELHAAGGIPPESRRLMGTLGLGDGLCGRVALRREPVVVPHLQSSSDPGAQACRKLGLRSYAGFPLYVGERTLGTLAFGSYAQDVIVADEIEFLTRLSQYFSVAIDRAYRERDLRDAQQSLSEHAGQLEMRIAERTARLHETIEQLESFSYTIAHDLRAPIRSLKGFTEILLSDYAADVPEDAQLLLRRLQRASTRLDALTHDLLKFSRIARHEVQLSPVDLDELVTDILALTPGLNEGVVTIEPPLGKVCAQRTMLQQCLSNLFDNALKFTAPGSPLRIRVHSERRHVPSPLAAAATEPPFSPAATAASSDAGAEPQDPGSESVRIWIEDNGIGIAPHAHEKIFGIFERVSGLDHVEGTGIGLAIVARAMQRMGGSCGVESAPGAGSRFWLELAAANAG